MKQVKTAFYLLQSKTNKKGEAPVYFRAKFKHQTIRLSTAIYLNPDNWDNQKLRVKAKHPRSYNLNKQMKDMQDKFFKILDETTANSTTVSLNKIKQILNGKDDKVTSLLSLTNYFINYIENNPNYSEGRIRHYKSFKNKMINFLCSKYSASDLNLENLNYEFIIRFETFLSAYYKNGVNTVTSNIKRLKAIVNTGIKLGWLKADPFNSYKCKFEPSNRKFLSTDELKRIQQLDLPEKGKISLVRDIFLFMSYTGISYGDISRLNKSNIVKIDGDELLIFERGKTDVESKPFLLPEAKIIIEKYKDSPLHSNKDHLLPIPSNNTMNKNLKIIAQKAGITKNLSCHIGRHTYATLSLEYGIPIETLSKALGHASIKTTQIYGKITEAKICKDYSKMVGAFSY